MAQPWSFSPNLNNEISTAPGPQDYPTSTTDGAGGAIITWQSRTGPSTYNIYAQRIDADGDVVWMPSGGVVISGPSSSPIHPSITSDAVGGAYITWVETTGSGFLNTTDIYAQHIDAGGHLLWKVNGIAVGAAVGNQHEPTITSDGAGGTIIAWSDQRGPGPAIFAQRIAADGSIHPGWNLSGVRLGSATIPAGPSITGNGAGGAIVTWSKNGRIFAQRIAGGGGDLWTPPDGVPVTTLVNTAQTDPQIVSDGAGGAIITWYDFRNGFGHRVFAQHIGAGGLTGWTADGVAVTNGLSFEEFDQIDPVIVSDGANGAIITWSEERDTGLLYDIYAQRISSAGALQWTAKGKDISTAPNNQGHASIVSDGAGGAVITWEDDRANGNEVNDIYAQHVDQNGSADPGWTPGGEAISTALGNQVFRFSPNPHRPTIVSNGQGCAIITWFDGRSPGDNSDIYAQQINGGGDLGHPCNCPAITIDPPALVHPTGKIEVPYTSLNFTATGGPGPFTFVVSEGTLPPGLVLESNGLLHGTPVTAGTYTFTVSAVDANGCFGARVYQITICPVITLSPGPGLPTSVVNTPYSHTFTATPACGSAFNFSIANGTLPPGLMLASNGVLSGTAPQGGDFNFTLMATDPCGCSQTKEYFLRVNSEANMVLAKKLVISAFRENGPRGSGDEFVEIFNPSKDPVTISALPGVSSAGIGVFSSAGNNAGPTSNGVTLRCQIPSTTVIKGRGWYLCAGDDYSLNNLGNNGGPAPGHSVRDAQILGDIPNDAGLVLLNVGTNNVMVDFAGFFSDGNPAVVFDSVGFAPYGLTAPANAGQPSFASKYCEGTCLQPVGDASTIPSSTCPLTVDQAGAAFPVQQGGFVGGVAVCYGESGQYQIGRRRSVQQFVLNHGAGNLHRDTDNNADDFILLAPNPSGNVGLAITGRGGVSSVLGAAGPHSMKSPPILGQGIYTGGAFDQGNTNQFGPGNAERQYGSVFNILNPNNNPLGAFLLRFRFTNNGNAAVSGVRFRIDDLTGLCGPQSGAYATGTGGGSPPTPPPPTFGSTAQTATQEARNLRPATTTTSTPTCQGEGTENGLFTAVLKGVNHYAEFVSQTSDGTKFFVNGSSLEDVGTIPGLTSMSPLGGGGNNSYVINSNMSPTAVGDGVSGGPGSFAVAQPNVGSTSSSTRVLRVAFKFGVVKSGRFKLLLGREAFGPAPVN